jgi:ketosteroid isomerase-like protein
VSQENVEIVRLATQAHRLHDNETALSLYDPEVEMQIPDFDGTVQFYRGVDGIQAWYRDLLEAVTDFTTTVDEFIDGGSEVIAVLRQSGQGRRSGAPFERRETHVWSVREGKLWRLRTYRDRAEALRAVGLEE